MLYIILYQTSENEGPAKVIGYLEEKEDAERFCTLLQENSFGRYSVHEAESII